MLRTRIFRVLLGGFYLVTASCGSDSPEQDPWKDRPCSAGAPSGTPRELDKDGRITVTASEAWPGHVETQSPLSADEVAKACAIASACKLGDDGKPLGDAAIAMLTQDCAKGAGPGAKEEREIPQAGINERWVFEARQLIAAKSGDCASIRAVETPRPAEIVCQEDGCWWDSPVTAPGVVCARPIPKVKCDGNVATLATRDATYTRDCSRSLVACNESSSTGCSDRPPTACDPAGKDNCDGNVKIGCDSDGRISFHDCARYPGGTCVLDPGGGAHCELQQAACDSVSVGCDAMHPGKLDLCVAGTKVTVDCADLGMSGCSAGHCVPKG